jgi:hypothetical protein
MSILDKKRKVFGSIAAEKTLIESMPQLKLSSSIPSINNNGDSITFLTDLIKSLIGYGALVKSVVDILTHSLGDIEVEIKKNLKTQLKGIVSCGVNPSIPAFIKSTGSGIVINVKKIDFLDQLKVDPRSTSGKLMYNDVTPNLLDSSDFNTFLYQVIQDDGITRTWKGILDVTFVSLDPNGINPNNSLIIKANPAYNSKKLDDLNNDYIDSLELFNTESLLNKIVDILYGSITVNLSKTRKQLEAEAKINTVIGKFVTADAGDTIDDSYFTFDNVEMTKIEAEADNRKRGIVKIKASTDIDASIAESTLTDFNTAMGTAVTVQTKKDVLTTSIDSMANETAKDSSNQADNQTIKLNFIQQIIDTLIKSIVGIILSPKVVMTFLINFKIIYGSGAEFTDGVDFINKNKELMRSMIKKITLEIVQFLVVIAMKKIAELVAESQVKKQKEKYTNRISQLLSLTGVPQEAIRTIKGLT